MLFGSWVLIWPARVQSECVCNSDAANTLCHIDFLCTIKICLIYLIAPQKDQVVPHCMRCSLWQTKRRNHFCPPCCAAQFPFCCSLWSMTEEVNKHLYINVHKNRNVSLMPQRSFGHLANSCNKDDELKLLLLTGCAVLHFTQYLYQFPSDSIPDEELLVHKRNCPCCYEESTKGRYCTLMYCIVLMSGVFTPRAE